MAFAAWPRAETVEPQRDRGWRPASCPQGVGRSAGFVLEVAERIRAARANVMREIAVNPVPGQCRPCGVRGWVDEKLVLTGSEAPAGPLAHRPRRFWP